MQSKNINIEEIRDGLIQYNRVVFIKGDVMFFYNGGEYCGKIFWEKFSTSCEIIQHAKELFEEARHPKKSEEYA